MIYINATIINIKFTNTFFVLLESSGTVFNSCIVLAYFRKSTKTFGQGELSFYFFPWHTTIFEHWVY